MSETKQLLTALNKAMESCSYVQKTGRNDYHKYSYASEADLMETIRPAMVENGLMLLFSVSKTWVEGTRTFVELEYTLAHKSGETYGPLKSVGEAQDKGDKATYKAITGAHKYMYYKLFAIATGDDPEADRTVDEMAEDQTRQKQQAKQPDHPWQTGTPLTFLIDKVEQRQKGKAYVFRLSNDGKSSAASYRPKTPDEIEQAEVNYSSCQAILATITGWDKYGAQLSNVAWQDLAPPIDMDSGVTAKQVMETFGATNGAGNAQS